MDRETQVKKAARFCADLETLMRTVSREDFDQFCTLDDNLDSSDHLTVFRAAYLFDDVSRAFIRSRGAVIERQVEIDSQVITRADLRRWLEGRK